jgi:transcriptional regulator with XRE-family HTH domain
LPEDSAAFGAVLAACRRSAGLAQQELAKRAELSVRAVGNMERGRVRVPHPGTVRRLADALMLHQATFARSMMRRSRWS